MFCFPYVLYHCVCIQTMPITKFNVMSENYDAELVLNVEANLKYQYNFEVEFESFYICRSDHIQVEYLISLSSAKVKSS